MTFLHAESILDMNIFCFAILFYKITKLYLLYFQFDVLQERRDMCRWQDGEGADHCGIVCVSNRREATPNHPREIKIKRDVLGQLLPTYCQNDTTTKRRRG